MSAAHRRLQAALGWLFAAACLVWIFHDLDPRSLGRALRALRWWWLVPAVVADVFSYYCQGARWRILLRPLGRVTALQATRAIYAGLFTNEVLPLRVGEAVRSWLVAGQTGAPIARVIPSIAVERLFDGFWLTLAFALAAIAVPLPRELTRAADVTGVAVLAGIVLLAVVARRGTPRVAAPGGNRLRRLFAKFLAELHAMMLARGFLRAALISSGVLVFQALAFWLVMVACALPVSPWQGAIALLIVHLGTALPNAPGNVGSYQLFSVLALSLFGIGKVEATAFSMVAFVALTAPLWVLGLLALRAGGLSLGRVRREAAAWLKR